MVQGVEKVEFYIDNKFIGEDKDEPCVFQLRKGCHKIGAIAYDYSKNFASDEMRICLFSF